jgi:hypothetical protein
VRVNPVLILFALGGAAMVVVSYLPGVTDFLDSVSTPDSDPAGPVLQLIGWIWLAVSLVPLALSFVARRKGLDRLLRSRAVVEEDDAADSDRPPPPLGS